MYYFHDRDKVRYSEPPSAEGPEEESFFLELSFSPKKVPRINVFMRVSSPPLRRFYGDAVDFGFSLASPIFAHRLRVGYTHALTP